MVCLALVAGLLLVCHWGLGDLDAGLQVCYLGLTLNIITASWPAG